MPAVTRETNGLILQYRPKIELSLALLLFFDDLEMHTS